MDIYLNTPHYNRCSIFVSSQRSIVCLRDHPPCRALPRGTQSSPARSFATGFIATARGARLGSSSLPGSSCSIQSTSVSGPDVAMRFGVEVRGRCSSMGVSSRRRSRGARRSSRRRAAAAMVEQLVPLLIWWRSAMPQLPRTDSYQGEEGLHKGEEARASATTTKNLFCVGCKPVLGVGYSSRYYS
jgi:hypothetical protein